MKPNHHWLRTSPIMIVALLFLGSPTAAYAQASVQVPLQFDFLNPGARSLALGSAFIGLADDATAAFTNPAGLVILRFPEISFEGRGNRNESPFLAGGRLSGTPTGIGIDTRNGPDYGVSVSDTAGPSYVSFVYPGSNWAVAGYRHELVRLDLAFESNGVFQGPGFRELALQADRVLNMTTYGISGAVRATPAISFGGGVTITQLDMTSHFDRFFSPDIFGLPTYAPNTQLGRAVHEGDDIGIGFNVGGLFTLMERTSGGGPSLVQAGVVYRRAPALAVSGIVGDINNPTSIDGTFTAPDTFGGGLAVRFAQSALVTAEVTRLRYSRLSDFVAFNAFGAPGDKAGRFHIEDGTEIHAGFEYVLPVKGSPALRVGTWLDPAHSMQYDAPGNPDLADERFSAYLPGTEDLTHFTFGAGAALSNRFEVNFGADVSERTRVLSVSAVIRFVR